MVASRSRAHRERSGVWASVSAERDAGYARLAAAVVAQAYRDARVAPESASVAASITSGWLPWWLEVAGLDADVAAAACARIMTRVAGRAAHT